MELLAGGFNGGGHAPGRNQMSFISIWHPPDSLFHFSGNSHPETSRRFGSYSAIGILTMSEVSRQELSFANCCVY